METSTKRIYKYQENMQGLRLHGEDIKRSDFCYLGSSVNENGGTSKEINTRIQKARGSFLS
jgi:hypothetical protein